MVLGITGISGSGKHTSAEYFRKKGWVIIDTDSLAHYLYRPYTGAWKEISKQFGEKILNQDDTINRAKLGQIVFNQADPEGAKEALAKLNSIIHPYIIRHVKNEIYMNKKRKSDIAVVSALWQKFEKGICEKMLLVKAAPELRSKRIISRDGINEQMYGMRIKNQEEPENPDFVIENNGSLLDLNKKLDELFTRLTIKD